MEKTCETCRFCEVSGLPYGRCHRYPKEVIIYNTSTYKCGEWIFKKKIELYKYRKAYHILMEYWDSLPDEERPKINKRLRELGL